MKPVFDAFPVPARNRLLDLRERIFRQAADLPVGPVEETLKWGQPSYATPRTKTATPLRLGLTKTGVPAIFVHCQSNVIASVRQIAPPDVLFDGTRALHLPLEKDMPDEGFVAALIHAALTYRL